jgi:hypothetical protein
MTRHLIHVGFHKTGSTYLQSWFARHPEIVYEPGQVAACRSVDGLIEQATALPPNRPRVTSCEDFSAPSRGHSEWSGMAAAQLAVCETLRGLFPEAHILIVTRNFEAIVESAYAELVRHGRAEHYEEFLRSPSILHVLPDILNYDRLIAAYRHAFDGRVTVLPYELLRDDCAAFLRAIEAVLEIRSIDWSAAVENARLSPEELRWYPAFARLVRAAPVGERVRGRLAALLVRAIRSGRLRPLVGRLEGLRGPTRRSAGTISREVLEQLRAGAAGLVEEPSHRPYAAEYLGRPTAP